MRLARLPRCSVRYYCAVLLRLSFDPQNLPRGPTRELRLIFLTVASQRSSRSPLVPGSQPHCAPLQSTLAACEHDEKVDMVYGVQVRGSELGPRKPLKDLLLCTTCYSYGFFRCKSGTQYPVCCLAAAAARSEHFRRIFSLADAGITLCCRLYAVCKVMILRAPRTSSCAKIRQPTDDEFLDLCTRSVS